MRLLTFKNKVKKKIISIYVYSFRYVFYPSNKVLENLKNDP